VIKVGAALLVMAASGLLLLAILSLPPIRIIISNISGMVSSMNIRIEIPLEILTALTLLIIGPPPITALAGTALLAISLKINKN